MCALEGFVKPKQFKATLSFSVKNKLLLVITQKHFFNIYKDEKEVKVIIMKCSDHATLTTNDIPFLFPTLEPFREL